MGQSKTIEYAKNITAGMMELKQTVRYWKNKLKQMEVSI